MSATALLKFSQGIVIGGDGESLIGVAGEVVTLFNVDNAGVKSWQIDLVAVDANSTYSVQDEFAFNNNNTTPTTTFEPDVPGCYRWVLKVWDVPNRVGTPVDVDIRIFCVKELNGMIVPPSQVFPLPLPDPRTGLAGAKPNEFNFGGQLTGFAGDGHTDGFLGQLIRNVDTGKLWQFETHTTTATPTWLATFSVEDLPPCYIRAEFDVIVDNADGNNCGYLKRMSLFRLNSARVLTHLATGESVFCGADPAPVDGAGPMVFPHKVIASSHSGHFIGLQGVPSGSTPTELDLFWLTTIQFFITKRS
jgi:hypothetical protein